MQPSARKPLRYLAAALVGTAASLVIAPALADKPLTVLDQPISTTVTAIPIDFDRENPERKEFGKLIFRGGLNLFAKSSYFGGYSALALDPSGTKLLAISDAGTWLKADLEYDGRALKGLGNVVLGPILGEDGKPLLSDQDRDSEGMTLAEGDPKQGTAYVSFERKHRIARYPLTADRFGPPTGTVTLPPGAKRMDSNRGIEALAMITAGRLKGTLVAFSERLPDKSGNLTGWLIGGPSLGTIALMPIEGFDITDAAALPDGGLVILERRFRYSEGIKMRMCRVSAAELKPGRHQGRRAARSDRQSQYRQHGSDRRSSPRLGRDRPHADVGRQFQPAPADADHAVHASRREVGCLGPSCQLILRHARPYAGHPRVSIHGSKDVDGRDKPGHDGVLVISLN